MSLTFRGDQIRAEIEDGGVAAVGDWDLIQFLGRGGFGFTFKARNRSNGSVCALKIIDDSYEWQRRYYSHFISEARALDAVQSENVVKIFEHGEAEDFLWIAMEFIQGYTLDAHVLTYGPLNKVDFMDLSEQLLSGLVSIHHAGLGHHDIKPSNIMRDEIGKRWVFVDFGLSMVQHPAGIQANQIQGTLAYAPPEVFEAFSAKGSDIFSLGTVFWESLIGYNPWIEIANTLDIDNRLERMRVAVQDHSVDLTVIPFEYRQLILAMQHRDPKARPNAKTLLQWIRSIANGSPPPQFSEKETVDAESPVEKPVGLSMGEISHLAWEEFSQILSDGLADRGTPIQIIVESADVAELVFTVSKNGNFTEVSATLSTNSSASRSLGWSVDATNPLRRRNVKSLSGEDELASVAEAIANSLRLVWALKLGSFSIIYLPTVD
jgi:serine/threonine protein kinase